MDIRYKFRIIHGMISLTSVSYRYNEQQPEIHFKDWQINRGEQWLMLGESGSGKTTLLHIMAGLLKPQKGELVIDGNSLNRFTERELDRFRGRHIGLIFQRPHFIKSLTITENLLVAQSFTGFSTDLKRIYEVFESLAIAGKKNNYPSELSHGQLQRVSIARAVVNKPAIIMADEPTSSLDDKNTASVLDLLTEQSALTNSTLIVSTHDKRVKDRLKNEYVVKI